MRKSAILLASAAILATAGAASAVEVNVYGASAQGGFLKANAAAYLVSLGCDATTSVSTNEHSAIDPTNELINTAANADTYTSFYAICPAANNPAGTKPFSGTGDLILRTVSYASQQGIMAVSNMLGGDANCQAAAGTGPFAADAGLPHTNDYRPFLNNLIARPGNGASDVANLACKQVTLGNSDTAPNSFVQCWKAATDVAATPLRCVTPVTPAAGAKDYANRPAAELFATPVVPFAFYVNNQVTDSGTAATITNLTKVQAQMILQGTAVNWNDLDTKWSAQPITVCFRRPGSGTHAALDATYFWHEGISWNYVTQGINGWEDNAAVFYNLSSGDMKSCLAKPFAFGYLDADNGNTAGAAGYKRLLLDGQDAVARNVATGAYPFAAVAHYYRQIGLVDTAGTPGAAADLLVKYVADPATLGGTAPGSTAKPQWASSCELRVKKDQDTDRGFWHLLGTPGNCPNGTAPRF